MAQKLTTPTSDVPVWIFSRILRRIWVITVDLKYSATLQVQPGLEIILAKQDKWVRHENLQSLYEHQIDAVYPTCRIRMSPVPI